MSRHIRRQLGLTQDRLAAWLGMRRGTLAISATGLRGLPPGMSLPLARLGMAWLAQVLLPNGQAVPAPSPLPPAPPPARPPARPGTIALASSRVPGPHPPASLRRPGG